VDSAGRIVVADQDGHGAVLIDPRPRAHGATVGLLGSSAPRMGPSEFDDPEGGLGHGACHRIADSDDDRAERRAIAAT
jgi:hypothetical protein